MAAKTWDTSRTGGGTYEFTQDTQGNYTLGSVGFAKLNKLNLPELKKEKEADTTKSAATESAQTKQAFGDVQPFYYGQTGDGADTQYTMRKEGDLSTEIKPIVTGDSTLPPQLGGPSTLEQAKQFAGGSIKKDTMPKWAEGADKRGYEKATTKAEPVNQLGRVNAGQVLAAKKTAEQDKFKTGMMYGPKKPDPYQDAIMKGETGVKYEKPDIPQIAKTKLNQVNTSLKTLATVAGVMFNPVVGIGKMLLGGAETTPMQKHDMQYFNTVGNTNRIAGNPATDLYAGMNKTSMLGDPGKAGDKRIETRTKTAAKMKGKWSKEQMDRFTSRTEDMKEQAIDHKKSQTAVMKNVPPSQRGNGNGGCFLKGTPITMANGSTKPVDQVDLGDKVAEGGKVFAAGRFLINDLYDYKGIKVSGSHMVNENDTWVRIRDSKKGKLLGDDEHTVYVFGAENRRILIKGILFTDYFEVREQDKLATIGDKYFEEWRDHDKILVNLEENHNVSVLNSH